MEGNGISRAWHTRVGVGCCTVVTGVGGLEPETATAVGHDTPAETMRLEEMDVGRKARTPIATDEK